MKRLFFSKVALSVSLCLLVAMRAGAVPRADRVARVDAEGVMRWVDDQSEVALVGVNYYPPFTVDFKHLKARKADIKAVMREDVAHFRRLGLGVMRIHCFDREFSTVDGGFIDNEHVELLDYLIDLGAANGLYMVLTPIAWWGGSYAPDSTHGFSDRYTMHKLTADRATWPIQARFLKEFASHVNRYTHRRYADDPAVLAFECINEPLYPFRHPDAEVTAYVNALVDGLRASGTTKPIFYNSWGRRNAAVAAARVDGVTCSYYPTGLVAGHALEEPCLNRILASSLKPDASLAKKARLVYEFDAADCPGSYMYPALGKLFRHEGVQVAAMFQYDPLPLAPVNEGWKTHHLNLVYTPAKAISIAIMAETFKHLPRACPYAPAFDEIAFSPFRVNALRDLSEFVTKDRYYYTNDPMTPPPDVSALRHVWGCGTSCVVASTGNGAYFLDRVSSGVWRLQLYPSIFTVADPYTGTPDVKEVVLAKPATLTLHLPDLGDAWVATPLTGSTPVTGHTLSFGDYVLTAHAPTAAQLATARAADLPPFHAPVPEASTPHVRARVPVQWSTREPFPISLQSAGVKTVTAHFERVGTPMMLNRPLENVGGLSPVSLKMPALAAGNWQVSFTACGENGTTVRYPAKGGTDGFPVNICEKASAWEFFTVAEALKGRVHGVWGRMSSVQNEKGAPAFRLNVDKFLKENSATSLRLDVDGAAFAQHFPQGAASHTLVLHARSGEVRTDKLEVVLVLSNGQPWGTNVELTPEWRDIRIPLDSLRYFAHWHAPSISATDKPDIARLQAVNFCFGRWLYPATYTQSHSIEISSLHVE